MGFLLCNGCIATINAVCSVWFLLSQFFFYIDQNWEFRCVTVVLQQFRQFAMFHYFFPFFSSKVDQNFKFWCRIVALWQWLQFAVFNSYFWPFSWIRSELGLMRFAVFDFYFPNFFFILTGIGISLCKHCSIPTFRIFF